MPPDPNCLLTTATNYERLNLAQASKTTRPQLGSINNGLFSGPEPWQSINPRSVGQCCLARIVKKPVYFWRREMLLDVGCYGDSGFKPVPKESRPFNVDRVVVRFLLANSFRIAGQVAVKYIAYSSLTHWLNILLPSNCGPSIWTID